MLKILIKIYKIKWVKFGLWREDERIELPKA